MAVKRQIKRFLKIAAGVILLVLGCAGLFLPVLQGILMIMAGLALLSTEIPAVKSFNDRARSRLRTIFARRGKRPDPGKD